MSDCTCGRNGWFSPPEPDCPEHGRRGSENRDYQLGRMDSKPAQVDQASMASIILGVLEDSARLSRADAKGLTEEIMLRLREALR